MRRYYDAITSYRRAADLRPDYAAAWLALGDVYLETGRYDQARVVFERVVGLTPEDATTHLGLGEVYREDGNYEASISAYRRAVELDPAMAAAWGGLGDVLHLTDAYEDAINAYQQAVSLNPNDSCSRGSLAGLYRRLNRREEYEQEIELAQNSISDRNEYNLACLFAIAGESREALRYLKLAIDKRLVTADWARVDPDLYFLRDNPQFQRIVGFGKS